MNSLRTSLASLVAVSALALPFFAACSSSDDAAANTSDASADSSATADSGATTGDAAKDGDAADAAAVCNVDPAPSGVPKISATWVIIGSPKTAPNDGGTGDASADASDSGISTSPVWTVPPMTGGDPKGTWVIDKATFYLPSVADGVVDTSKSTANGSAWASVDATKYRFFADFDTVLDTNVVGTVSTKTATTSKGGYTLEGSTLKFVTECSSGSSGAAPELEYSVDGTRGMLLSKITTQLGQLIVVFEGSIASAN
jgi:hypothetical protein